MLSGSGFPKVLTRPCGYIYHCSMTISHALLPEGLKVMHCEQWLTLNIFPQTPSISLTISCTVDAEILH